MTVSTGPALPLVSNSRSGSTASTPLARPHSSALYSSTRQMSSPSSPFAADREFSGAHSNNLDDAGSVSSPIEHFGSQTRPHFCPVRGCPRSEGGKGFKRKNEMIRHGLRHGSPGYVCPFCPDREHRYPRPDNLQRYYQSPRSAEQIPDQK